MSRTWSEFVALLSDLLSLPLILLILLLLATAVALLWYYFPAWLPRRRRGEKRKWRLRWPKWRWRWRRPRFRWPWKRKAKTKSVTVEQQIEELIASEEELPEVPPAVYQTLADRLAAEGRYAEALRERYRSAIRDLVQHGVIDNRPGWTVTELARAAGSARPQVDGSLRSASALFSEVWYAEHPATAGHDDQMRTLADEVHQTLVVPR
ncbi:hypothetical protein HDA40_005215 [Hamadaea flava]|uniref:DUF4129 domain-containing protein n=1 Tax=Hamadaea flava TaxID=1742688 RepID=A0ABV8M266_9ACTN|nr:DUF4129 domain-containing protein [Hamadaea flava]MCP2326708.1 hypothetical protein [Hamadaea flava]